MVSLGRARPLCGAARVARVGAALVGAAVTGTAFAATAVTGTAFAATAVTGTAFAADPGGGVGAVTVVPADPSRGEEVELRVTGCAGDFGNARSAAFVADAPLAPDPTEAGVLVGETLVSSTAEPGSHPVEVSCDGHEATVTGELVVSDATAGAADPGGATGAADATRPATPAEPSPQPASPTAPVQAGGGGTATGQGGGGASLTIGPAGLAVLAGTLLSGTAVAARRRTRSGE
ncbi:hypothetical protein [Streptomyces sp. B6B3]|uniref:hypothetical protein n=1 Tax=Streptomyces sp. B6B3 TaxID=3153570 RepID=UPI00325E36D4